MTEALYTDLLKKYPETGNQIIFCGNYERIYLVLRDDSFIGKGSLHLINLDELILICENNFKGNYKIKSEKDLKESAFIRIDPNQKMNFRSYDNHLIKLRQFYPPLDLEICTGKYRADLNNSQRRKYINFVSNVFDKFKENALKCSKNSRFNQTN